VSSPLIGRQVHDSDLSKSQLFFSRGIDGSRQGSSGKTGPSPKRHAKTGWLAEEFSTCRTRSLLHLAQLCDDAISSVVHWFPLAQQDAQEVAPLAFEYSPIPQSLQFALPESNAYTTAAKEMRKKYTTQQPKKKKQT
jgi:hypothetical protein